MKYVIVSGSHRKDSQSEKVAHYLEGRLLNFDGNSEVSIVSLASNPLPLWDEDYPTKGAQWKEVWRCGSRSRPSSTKPMLSSLSCRSGVAWFRPE